MSRVTQARGFRLPRPAPRRALGLLACFLLLGAGCAKSHNVIENDPLVGGPALPRGSLGDNRPGACRGCRDSRQQHQRPVAQLPVPSSTTSNAALAGGVNQALDPGNPLRQVADTAAAGTSPVPNDGQGGTAGVLLSRPTPLNPGTPVPDPGHSQGFQGTGDSFEPAAVMLTGSVIPLHDPTSGPDPAGVPATSPLIVPGPAGGVSPPAGPVPVDSFAQVYGQLLARGVTRYRLDKVGEPDLWLCICSVPDPHDPTLNQVHQATLPGERGLAAMRAVLAQIDSQPRP